MPRLPSLRGRGTYAPQACELCRSRKTKCSGHKPICEFCQVTGQDCLWRAESHKRPNKTQSLRQRIKGLEQYVGVLEAKLAQCRQEHGDLADDSASYLNLRPEMTPLPDELDDSSDSGEDSEVEKLGALKLTSEHSELQLWGPTSIFQFAPKFPEQASRFPEIVENTSLRYVLLVGDYDTSHYNPDFEWCRHLPSEVPLTRLEHDKVLDLLFKFFTSWCLRIVPDLFLRDMYRALCVPRSQTPPKTTHYSPMLHNALLALATAFSDDPRIRDYKSRLYYATAARNYVDVECQSPNISAVHALSLLGSFHSSQGDQTLGYMYFGMSGRISQALGLSIDCSPWVKANLITQNDMLDRNWAYWTTFSLDVCWSLYVGREFCVTSPSDHQTIPVPFVDTDFDEIPWHYPPSGIPPQPNHLSRTFAETCELLRIGRRIMDVVNVLNSPGTRRNINHGLIGQIDAQLNAWKERLPQEVDITSTSLPTATSHRLMLHLAYWQLFILLHRPFYRRTRPSIGSEKDIDHVKFCNTAAQNIMELLHTWRSLYTLRYTPITLIQVVFSAGTIFLVSAAQAISRSRAVDISAVSDLLSQIEVCSQYLHEIGKSWRCANHVANILENLLQERLKPRLAMRSVNKNNRPVRSQSVETRNSSDPAASPIALHHPYVEDTSPISPLFDQPYSDWFPGSPSMADSQIESHLSRQALGRDVTGVENILGTCTRMTLGSSMGLGMRSGETLSSRPFMSLVLDQSLSAPGPWNPAELTDDELLQHLQQLINQQQQYQYLTN